MLIERFKDPAKVKAGQARQRQLREQLGEQGYRDYQKHCYASALLAHPDFHRIGAQAANAAQLTCWGVQGYITQRQDAYRACREKYGAAFARAVVQAAHEARRLYRLDHPTPAEATIRALLVDCGFRVLLSQERFDYCDWRSDPLDWQFGDHDILAEGGVGPYYCDLLLPVRRIAIEVEGGVHILSRERDAQRQAFLEAQGLTVLVLSNDLACDRCAARDALLPALLPYQPPLFHHDY